MDATNLFGALLFVGSAHALWWKFIGLHEGKTYKHSYTEWFLENREKHQKNLRAFDERLVEIDFFGQELPDEGEEPSIVVDYDQLMGTDKAQLVMPEAEAARAPQPPPLPDLKLPRLDDLTHQQVITALSHKIDDPICDVTYSDMDDEPSIVIDYKQLGLASDGDKAIVIDPTMDDGTDAMQVTVEDVLSLKVYKDPEQLSLGL